MVHQDPDPSAPRSRPSEPLLNQLGRLAFYALAILLASMILVAIFGQKTGEVVGAYPVDRTKTK